MLGEKTCIETVDDGKQAVAICNHKHFNAILLDLQMPILNGLEAACLIHQESVLNKNTPIILISANSYDLNKEHLGKAGIELCLEKPIDEETLLRHLLHIIGKSKSAAINWPLCVQKLSGNQALATEFLARFVEELQKNRDEFIQLMQAQNVQELERAAHKLHGACCFCGVPALQSHVARMENLASNARHVDELQLAFSELIHSIDAVLSEYASVYIPRANAQPHKENLCQ